MNWDPNKLPQMQMMEAIYAQGSGGQPGGGQFVGQLFNSQQPQQLTTLVGRGDPTVDDANIINMSMQQSQLVQQQQQQQLLQQQQQVQQQQQPTAAQLKQQTHHPQHQRTNNTVRHPKPLPPPAPSPSSHHSSPSGNTPVVLRPFDPECDETRAKLIELVRACREVWYPTSMQTSDERGSIHRARGKTGDWEQIARALATTVSNVKLMWSKVRDDYRRAYKRALKKYEMDTGTERPLESYFTWKFSESMHFMLPVIHNNQAENKGDPSRRMDVSVDEVKIDQLLANTDHESWESRAAELESSVQGTSEAVDADGSPRTMANGGLVTRKRPIDGVEDRPYSFKHRLGDRPRPLTNAERKTERLNKRNMHFGSYIGTSLSAMSPSDQLRARLRIHQVICDMEADTL